MVIKKRQLLAATLVMALGAAVFVNWYYTRPESRAVSALPAEKQTQKVRNDSELGEARYVLSTDVAQNKTDDAFFDEAVKKRKAAHDDAAEKLNKIITDPSSPSSAVREATEKLTDLAGTLETEAKLENLITAKTGCPCLAAIDDSTAQIVISTDVLDATSALQIKELASNQTGLNGDKITIIEYNG